MTLLSGLKADNPPALYDCVLAAKVQRILVYFKKSDWFGMFESYLHWKAFRKFSRFLSEGKEVFQSPLNRRNRSLCFFLREPAFTFRSLNHQFVSDGHILGYLPFSTTANKCHEFHLIQDSSFFLNCHWRVSR